MSSVIIEIALLISPIILGMLSARLFTPKVYKQCGKKSKLQPPGWVFALAWSVLYILLGVSAMLVYRKQDFSPLLISILISIALLITWWLVFANICSPFASYVAIYVILGIVVANVTALFKGKMFIAGSLMIPLCLWLVFASLLISL